MREIKFRAWSEKLHRFLGVWGVYQHEDGAYQSGPFSGSGEPYVNEQFTGLHDKNGKEIYEGDILKSNHFTDVRGHKHFLNHFITWSEKYSGWFSNSPTAKDEYDGCLQMWCYMKDAPNIEVIGNIHENPELLEVNK